MEDHGASSSHNHRREEDTPPGPPSSPLTTAFHRHPQLPTPTPNAEDIDPFLRRRPERRASQQGTDTQRGTSPGHREHQAGLPGDTVLVSIATPYNDVGGSKKNASRAIPVSSNVASIKDDLASGKWDGDEWERRNMRLVWQGRIVRDEEVLKDMLGKVSFVTYKLPVVADDLDSMPMTPSGHILFTSSLDGSLRRHVRPYPFRKPYRAPPP